MISYWDTTEYLQQQFALWKAAKWFPPLKAKGDYVLNFHLGRDDFGFSYGNYDKRYTGPRLDITGATVKLIAVQLAYKANLVMASRGQYDYRGSLISTLFDVTGDITDAEEGEVNFTLTDRNTDGLGNYLAQIEITTANELKIFPGDFRLRLLKNVR